MKTNLLITGIPVKGIKKTVMIVISNIFLTLIVIQDSFLLSLPNIFWVGGIISVKWFYLLCVTNCIWRSSKSAWLKVLQYFGNMRHNSVAPNAFAKVENVLYHTGQCDAKLNSQRA